MGEWDIGLVGCGDGRASKFLLFWYAARARRGGAGRAVKVSCRPVLVQEVGGWLVGWLATVRILQCLPWGCCEWAGRVG